MEGLGLGVETSRKVTSSQGLERACFTREEEDTVVLL
jgi:hypothetical protein